MATIGNGAYKVQLLLSEDAARFVRKVMLNAIQNDTSVSDADEDCAYAIIAEIAQGLKR